MSKFFDVRGWQKVLSVSLSVVLCFVLVVVVAQAASTISANISTDGTLIVGGGTEIGGPTAPASGLEVTGIASSSSLVVGGGTSITRVEKGSCSPSFSSADLAASTTAVGICTDASFVSTDSVIATQKLTSVLGLLGNMAFPVKSIVATTSGQFGIIVTNELGVATTSINSVFRTYSYILVR